MIRTAIAILVALVVVGQATTQTTWNGSTTDWNTASNWNPTGVPTSSTPVQFTDTHAGSVNISASATAQSLSFTNQSASYTITSSASQTLTVSSITMSGSSLSVINTVNLANFANGSLLFPVATNLVLTNNSAGGLLTIGPNTVIGTPGSGSVQIVGAGSTAISGSFAPGSFAVDGGLSKSGPGLLFLSGNGTNLAGGITLQGGLTEFDYSSNTAAKLGSGALNLEGCILTLLTNSSVGVTQTISGGTSVSFGHNEIGPAGTGTATLAAGTILRSAGGTLDFATPGGSTLFVTTGSTVTNGLLGAGPAFATYGGGANWATETAGNVGALSTYGTNTYASGTNSDVTTSMSLGATTTNSLRFNTGNPVLTLTGALTLQSGGVLVTPNSPGGTITGGTVTAPSSGELIIHVYDTAANSGLVVNSAIVSSAGLTKTGPGMLSLNGLNTQLTGPININAGGLTVLNPASVNSANALNFNQNGGSAQQQFVAQLGSGASTISPPIRLSTFSSSGYGTVFSTGTSDVSTVTLAGVISSLSATATPIQFAALPASTFNLTAANTFTGNVDVALGGVGINSDSSLGNASNTLFLDLNGISHGNGLVFLNSGVTVAHPVVLSSTSQIVCNGTDGNTISAPITGPGELIKNGTGTLTISSLFNTFSGNVAVLGGALSLGSTGIIHPGSNITVGAGATFSVGSTTTMPQIGVMTLNGGTFRNPAGTGLFYDVNQIITDSTGGIVDFTGATGVNALLINGSLPPAITINGNSTWLSPGNSTQIASGSALPITILTGVTFNNGIALGGGTAFMVSGGGRLFQNSDATNVLGMAGNITVGQGTTFEIADAASNGGVGNFGTGSITLDGATFEYSGATASTTKAISFSPNGATFQVDSVAATLTANGAISGPTVLTKTGPGALALGSSANFFVSLTVNAGTVQTANDNTLGEGPITVGGAGTLLYTGSTSTARTFNLNFGTLAAGTGATVTLNGANVIGGFLHGPGTFAVTGNSAFFGVTSFASATISQTGAGSFANFTNGGTLTLAANLATPVSFNQFTNQGSGSITVGAQSVVGVADFQTYGTLTISPATVTENFSQTTLMTNVGTSPLYFNGGSRTIVGTPATAIFPSNWPDASLRGLPTFVAGVDLNGKNAVVAGGLFVNNGYVEDSSNNFQGTATLVADFGSLVKGAGYFQNTVQTINGGKFQAGNSPGKATFGKFVFGPGGVSNYVFAIDNATGAAGPSPDAAGHVSGWSLVKVVGPAAAVRGPANEDFVWTATPADKLTIAIETLLNPTTVGTDIAGPMDHFDPTLPFSWPAVDWTGTYAGPADAAMLDASTAFDTSGFANSVAGSFGWALDGGGHELSLTYTPSAVPEPGTLTLLVAATGGFIVRRRFRPVFI
jgi:autotransporter-associated beta strand protein